MAAAFATIVVGLGATGGAAAYQLACRGHRVLGLDRFHPPHELLGANAMRACFPALSPPDGMVGVLEPRAGILFPERCVAAHVDEPLRRTPSIAM